MINPKELRMGNLIQWNEEVPAIVTVTGIHKDSIDFDGQYKGSMSVERFNPVPVTEERLLKFGFERDDIDYIKNKFRICKGDSFSNLIINNYVSAEFKYIHQLQNLYFCFTGEELIIK